MTFKLKGHVSFACNVLMIEVPFEVDQRPPRCQVRLTAREHLIWLDMNECGDAQ